MDSKKRIAIVPGSFDPITNGHLSIIAKAASEYDKVFVAVMINDTKKYMFSLEQRKNIAKAAVDGMDNVEVISSDGWLWELARDLGACAIVKGYRNEIDLEYENKMAIFNKERYPLAETVMIRADDTMRELSSTLVRELINGEKSLEEYLPIGAIEEIKKIASGK